VGQAATQGAGSQARQRLAAKLDDSPPVEWIRIPAVSQEIFLWTSLAQASAQEWQPMHRSMWGVVRIFKGLILGARLKKSYLLIMDNC